TAAASPWAYSSPQALSGQHWAVRVSGSRGKERSAWGMAAVSWGVISWESRGWALSEMVLEYWSSPSRTVQDQLPRRAVQDWFPTVTVSSGGAVSAVSGAGASG